MGTASSTNLTGRTGIIIDLKNIKKLDLNDVLDELNIDTGIKWSFGVGPKQANCLFHDSDEADGTNGLVKNINTGTVDAVLQESAFGDLITLDALKLLYVKNTHATLELHLLGGTTPIGICAGTDPIIKIAPGGFMLWIDPTKDGLDVKTGGNSNLKFLAGSTGTVTFDYALMGLD